MPCRDGREDEIEADNQHMRVGAELLCQFAGDLEKVGGAVLLPVPIQIWWAEHKKRDALRVERGW
jgi:hypothetical protein